MALADIVNVVVNINQSTIAQAGFSIPLIYAYHLLPDRVLTFRAQDWSRSMIDAGFTTTSEAYQVAAQMMRQTPRPAWFKVGRRTAAETQVQRLTPTVTTVGTNYRITLNNGTAAPVTLTYVVVDATLATITAGIAAMITGAAAATALGITAASDATGVTLTSTAGRPVGLDAATNLAVTDVSTGAGGGAIATDLAAIQAEDDDWYALVLAQAAPATILAAAAWIEGQYKILITSSQDAGMLAPAVVGSEDIATRVQSAGYARTHVAYHSRAHQHYGASWTSAMLVYEPGQADWRFKQLRGVDPDRITGTAETQLRNKNSSYYDRQLGRAMTGAAKGGDGTFVDLTQLSDWLRARVTEGIVALLTSAPKLAFTDEAAGNGIWGVLHNVVQRGISIGSIDAEPDTWDIYVPKRADLDPADRTARRWTGCVLTVTPTSSVHSVGTITINLNITG